MLPEILLSLRAINIFSGYGKDKKKKQVSMTLVICKTL